MFSQTVKHDLIHLECFREITSSLKSFLFMSLFFKYFSNRALRKLRPHSPSDPVAASLTSNIGLNLVMVYHMRSTVPPPASSTTKVSPYSDHEGHMPVKRGKQPLRAPRWGWLWSWHDHLRLLKGQSRRPMHKHPSSLLFHSKLQAQRK